MTWVKIDDNFPDHPKVARAGWQAGWLFTVGLCYCARQLTDGRIPKAVVARLTEMPRAGQQAARLVEVGLWDDDGDDYVVRGYLEYQPAADTIQQKRSELSEKRAAAGRKGAATRWQGDGKRDGKPMATGKQPDGKAMAPSPSPNPNPDLSSPQGTHAEGPEPLRRGGDEQQSLAHQAATLIAQHRHDTHPNPDSIRNPDAWRTTVTNEALTATTPIAHQHPDWTPDRIAATADKPYGDEWHATHRIPDADTTAQLIADIAARKAATAAEWKAHGPPDTSAARNAIRRRHPMGEEVP